MTATLGGNKGLASLRSESVAAMPPESVAVITGIRTRTLADFLHKVFDKTDSKWDFEKEWIDISTRTQPRVFCKVVK